MPLQDRSVKSTQLLGSLIRGLEELKQNKTSSDKEWVEKNLWIKDKRGAVIKFRFNRIQQRIDAARETARATGKKPRFIILKARREGVTTLQQAYSFAQICLKKNQSVVTLAHDKESTEKIFRISNLFYERLDSRIRPRRLTQHNKRDLNFPERNCLFYVGTPGTSGFGRGDTLNRVHWSEVAWSPGDKEDQRTLLSGLSEACSEGEIALESTPNGVGDLFHEKWVEATTPGSGSEWIPLFFTWWDDELNRIELTLEEKKELKGSLIAEEKELAKQNTLTLEQIEWRRRKKKDLKDLFDQEYPEDPATCFLSSGAALFDKMLLARLLFRVPKPIEERGDGEVTSRGVGGYTHIYERPKREVKYVIACDVAEGVPHGNYSVAAVQELVTGRQAATMRGKWTPSDFAERVYRLAKEYNNALVGVERNNHGHSCLNSLMHTVNDGNGYENLYYHMDYDARMGKHTLVLGWPTNKKTRPILLNDLKEAIEEGMFEEIKCRELLEECLTFKKNDRGEYEKEQGYYDDCIFAWGMAWQIRKDVHNKPVILDDKAILPVVVNQQMFPAATQGRIF